MVINTSNVSDRNVTVSLSTNNEGFHLFSLAAEISNENKELLDAMADMFIDEGIIEKILKIEATSNIALEPEKWEHSVPFVMPSPFGERRKDFDDFVVEWEQFQAQADTNNMVTYEFSALRPGEAKWLSPYLIIVPNAESFSLEYTILSEASGSKKSGTIEIHTNS